MRTVALLLILLCGKVSITIAQNFPVHSSAVDLELKGNVRSMEVYFINLSEDDDLSKLTIDSAVFSKRVELNKNGFPTHINYSRTVDYTGNKEIIEHDYIYNDEDILMKEDFTGDYGNDYAEYVYDINTGMLNVYVFGTGAFSGDTIQHRIEQYDTTGLMIHYEMMYCPNNQWRYWELKDFEYDDSGRVVKTVYFDSNRKELKTKTSTYNDRDHTMTDVEKYKDSDANVDPKKIIYRYDEQGNLIEQDWLGSEKNTYVYDDHGNWIERKHFRDGEPEEIRYRVFEYYE